MYKDCPLKAENESTKCLESGCAWWIDGIKKCAVCELAFIPLHLKNIATALEKK